MHLIFPLCNGKKPFGIFMVDFFLFLRGKGELVKLTEHIGGMAEGVVGTEHHLVNTVLPAEFDDFPQSRQRRRFR